MKKKLEDILGYVGMSLLATSFTALIIHDVVTYKEKTGRFTDPISNQEYNYKYRDNSIYLWQDDAISVGLGIGVQKLRDFNSDGDVDHVGGFTYARAPVEINDFKGASIEKKNHYQRLFDLAKQDYLQKNN